MLQLGQKKYVELIPSEHYHETHLEISVGYSLGGINWYNGKTEQRGYYLYCNPVLLRPEALDDGRTYTTITSRLGVGKKLLLKTVSRQSKKAEAEAIVLASEKENWLVEQVCNCYGLTVNKSKEAN